jgi:hypothetical protein
VGWWLSGGRVRHTDTADAGTDADTDADTDPLTHPATPRLLPVKLHLAASVTCICMLGTTS